MWNVQLQNCAGQFKVFVEDIQVENLFCLSVCNMTKHTFFKLYFQGY